METDCMYLNSAADVRNQKREKERERERGGRGGDVFTPYPP